jgi:hypothetical protein
MLINEQGHLVPLTMAERERALGYHTDTTLIPGCNEHDPVVYKVRHRVTGACMDANALKAIMALSVQLRVPVTDWGLCTKLGGGKRGRK